MKTVSIKKPLKNTPTLQPTDYLDGERQKFLTAMDPTFTLALWNECSRLITEIWGGCSYLWFRYEYKDMTNEPIMGKYMLPSKKYKPFKQIKNSGRLHSDVSYQIFIIPNDSVLASLEIEQCITFMYKVNRLDDIHQFLKVKRIQYGKHKLPKEGNS